MAPYGSNFRYGKSRYKDRGVAVAAQPPISVGMVGGNIVSFTLAILPTQGVGFSENSGNDFVIPFDACPGFSVIDTEGNERHIAIDSRDRKLYDIATRDGPENTTQVQRWMDKQGSDGTGGTDILPRVRFFDDLGSFENMLLRNATNHIFGRCANPLNRGATGYDADGFISGTEWTLKLFANGERLVAERTSETIPLTDNVHFGGHEEANRFAIELSATKSGHMITGRKMEYVVTDKYMGNNISTENTISDVLADPIAWFSRRPLVVMSSGNQTLVDRISGSILDEVNVGSTATASPPSNLGGKAITTNDRIYLFPGCVSVLFIGKDVVSAYADATELTLVDQGTYDGWTIYTISSIPSYSQLTIRPSATPGSFCTAYDIRQFSANLTAAQIAFYVDNIQNHNGDVVLP